MCKTIESIMFYDLNGYFTNEKDTVPAWVQEKDDAVRALLKMDDMDVSENDKYSNALLEMSHAYTLWGYIRGLKIGLNICKELEE